MKTISNFLLRLLLGIAVFPSVGNAESDYEKDVAFALAEVEAKAGHFFELKGIDWPAVSKQFSEEAKAVSNDQEHLVLLWRLLARVKDGHAAVMPTEKTKSVRWPEDKPESGMGMYWTRMGDHLIVKNAFSVAKDAGVEPGMKVVEVGGLKAEEWLEKRIAKLRDAWSFSTDHQAFFYATHWGLKGEVGAKVEVELRDLDRRNKRVEIKIGETRQVPNGPAFFPKPKDGEKYGGNSDLHWCEMTEEEGGFGYIHVRRCKGNLPEQMDEALADLGHLPGIILDWRGNSGGGFDHDALFGHFIPKGKTTSWGKTYQSAGANPYGGPVVVIIDATARSAGETGSGMFKEDGRAYAIGESPTAGMSSSKAEIALPSGLFTLRVSVYSNKARFNEGRGIEGVGVIPHETVEFDAKDLSEERDTLIGHAVELLQKGFPEGVVPFQPVEFGWEPGK